MEYNSKIVEGLSGILRPVVRRRLVKVSLFAIASAVALHVGPAWAADGPPSAAPPANGSTAISPVIVTAQKREQNPIEVPITLTAYSGAFLDKIGVQDLHDLSLRTPGFFLQNQSVNDRVL